MLALCGPLLVTSQREGPGQYARAKKDLEPLFSAMNLGFEFRSAKAFVEAQATADSGIA
jgi:hypothetical protein